MIRSSGALLSRLWPLLSAAASVTACANKPMTDAPTPPSGTSGAETPTVATAPATTATTAPRETGTAPPRSTAATTASAAVLPPCRACSLNCYAHAAGEKCLPGETGASLDARVGCQLRDRAGPSDDGTRCCYGQPCPGRPLLRDHVALIAPLCRGAATAAWV